MYECIISVSTYLHIYVYIHNSMCIVHTIYTYHVGDTESGWETHSRESASQKIPPTQKGEERNVRIDRCSATSRNTAQSTRRSPSLAHARHMHRKRCASANIRPYKTRGKKMSRASGDNIPASKAIGTLPQQRPSGLRFRRRLLPSIDLSRLS